LIFLSLRLCGLVILTGGMIPRLFASLALFLVIAATPLLANANVKPADLSRRSRSLLRRSEFSRLTTPQWVGEPDVEAVVILAIDDMREPPK